MKRSELVQLCLIGAMHGDTLPLMALLHYLLEDCAISPDRLIAIANRQFALPTLVAWGALYELTPQIIQ